MKNQRLNGLGCTCDIGDFAIAVQKFKVEISDDSKVAMRNGRPDGYLLGSVTGTGSITVDINDLKNIIKSADKSIQEIEPFDINSFCEVAGVELPIEVFGCKMKLATVLDMDKNNSDEITFEIPFDITSPDFVKLDGKPYLTEK